MALLLWTGPDRKLTTTALGDQHGKWIAVLELAAPVLRFAAEIVSQLETLDAAERSATLATDRWTTYWKGA